MASSAVYTPESLTAAIEEIPRYPLAHLPTPLEPLTRFSEAVGGPRLWIKRDDCTGLAFGGNKTRHNEFLIADAMIRGADTVVWGAGVQSNNCRQTAAACARADLKCHLVLGNGGEVGDVPLQGNLLLDHIVGASIQIVEEAEGPDLDARILQVAEELRSAGRHVYVRDPKHVKPLAAISYVECMVEIYRQAAACGWQPDAIYLCSAGSTGAGVALAAAAMGKAIPIRYITPIVWPWDTAETMAQIANGAAELLGLTTRLQSQDIDVTEEYVGPGYGIPTPGCLEAISLLARTEGILLDPSYSGKSMAGLMAEVREGRLGDAENVVFIHTGGTPAIFAYHRELADGIERAAL